jgi:hypothetical protein
MARQAALAELVSVRNSSRCSVSLTALFQDEGT